MLDPRIVRWRTWDGDGSEELLLREAPGGFEVVSALRRAHAGESFDASYRILLDAAWRTREVDVEIPPGRRRVSLRADGAGNWTQDAEPAPHLSGAIDVDITATPFTNTLPIRRLRWNDGDAHEIVVAYVAVPSGSVTAARQRYTFLRRGGFRFESLDDGFRRAIVVDDDGLVTEYPGLFRRVT